MSIKHIILKSGERLIAGVHEMVVDEKPIGFYLEKPCIVSLGNFDRPSNKTGREKTPVDVSLYPWIPFAKGTTVSIPLDWVVTIVDPVDMLMEMYQKNVLETTEEWNNGMNRTEEENGECKTCR